MGVVIQFDTANSLDFYLSQKLGIETCKIEKSGNIGTLCYEHYNTIIE